MAKLQTESITITVSKLFKNSDSEASATILITAEVLESLEAVISELVGEHVIVEIE